MTNNVFLIVACIATEKYCNLDEERCTFTKSFESNVLHDFFHFKSLLNCLLYFLLRFSFSFFRNVINTACFVSGDRKNSTRRRLNSSTKNYNRRATLLLSKIREFDTLEFVRICLVWLVSPDFVCGYFSLIMVEFCCRDSLILIVGGFPSWMKSWTECLKKEKKKEKSDFSVYSFSLGSPPAFNVFICSQYSCGTVEFEEWCVKVYIFFTLSKEF